MQNFRPDSIGKMCLALFSLTLLTQTVFGYEEGNLSYLDNVASSYIYNENGEYEDEKNILDINSPEARNIETTLKLDGNPIITNSNAKVNISLRDSDIRQALRMLADKANLNIVFDKSVEGKITLDLNNISINDAFLVIFKSTQLTYTLDSNTITVLSLKAAKEVGYTKKNLTVLPIKYVNAENVANFLNNNLFKSEIFGLSNKPIVTSNPNTNQIMIFGNNSDVNAIKRILPVLDTKPMVNNFKINHTTPKEMASLICNSLFYTRDKNNKEINGGNTKHTREDLILGSGKIACRDIADNVGQTVGGLSSFKSNPLTIAYFPELGQIGTYGGSVEQVQIIKDFIKANDKKQLMAYVELSVIELNETGSKDFSNTWNLWTPFIKLGFDSGSGLTTSSPFYVFGSENSIKVNNSITKPDGTTSNNTTPTVVSNSNNRALIYQLQYIIKNGNGRVLTNPKIMVTNGRKAVIDMTSDYIKTVTSQILQSTSAGGATTGTTQKTYEIGSDEGLLIEIMPFISPDGYVSMNIAPEFATIKGQEYTTNEAGERELAVTLLQRRDLDLKNIRIKDGETLVLAGLIKETETQSTSKMPILSDLPFIGVFFRSNSAIKAREELVIVVTPHIVKDELDSQNEQIYDL